MAALVPRLTNHPQTDTRLLSGHRGGTTALPKLSCLDISSLEEVETEVIQSSGFSVIKLS